MGSEATTPAPGLLLSDDLIFISRIVGTARALGLEMRTAPATDQLLELARKLRPACVLVDLANPGLEIAGFPDKLAEVCSPSPRLIAYGAHVDTARLRAAREAGFDLVWPRSKFAEELGSALPVWFGREQGGD
jgi:CheY-like chemotaxis protein